MNIKLAILGMKVGESNPLLQLHLVLDSNRLVAGAGSIGLNLT